MTMAVWDYIFFKDAQFPKSTSIPKASLEKMRKAFQFW